MSTPLTGGAGQPLHLRAVLLPDDVERELWVDAHGRFSLEEVPGATTVADGGFAVPGLVDAHCHVGLGADGAVPDDVAEAQARTDRDAGVLLIRDAGSAADTRWIDERVDLPVIVRAGRHLARTRRYLRNYGHEIEPEQLPDYAEAQARLGDGWVKLVGDWIDRDVGDLAPCWPADALRETIPRAHAAGARVTAHVFGEDALPDLLDAGIDCIEHGTGLDDDLLATMAERGVALVPTLVNIDTFPKIAAQAERFPRYARHMLALHAGSRDVVRRAHEAGVAVYAGTDAGGSLAHGLIASEVAALHEAGLPAVDALAAASWRAREWLARPGVEAGAPADLVVYDTDPRVDVGVLAVPARIVLRGRVVR
ncbi:MAG: amidohydrolase family protein [Actinomycetota bacterium]|nr:amidohydrolase family protein [Actinomycetota bacterium]